jgi:hypothetical protein
VKLLGIILAKGNLPGFDQARWIELIGQHASLSVMPARQGLNPFTREPMLFHSKDVALVTADGKKLGAMDWAPDDSHQVSVWIEDGVDADALEAIAADVAVRLDAVYRRVPE